MIAITLTPDGNSLEVRLVSYLGGERFAQFREAVASVGGCYSPISKSNLVSPIRLPFLLEALAKASLPASVAPEVTARLHEQVAQVEGLLAEGKERVRASKARLADQGLALYRYQETGIEWLTPRKAALLGDDMGLGKTVQALVALPERAAVNVVAPASLLRVWRNEVQRWRPDLRPVILNGEVFRMPEPGEVLISSYQSLPTPEEAAGRFLPSLGAYLICDEAHLIKNPKAKRTKAVVALKQILDAHAGAVWLITGTPMLNRPGELWSLLQVAGLAREAFDSYSRFSRIFGGMAVAGRTTWDAAAMDQGEIAARLQRVMLRRRKADVLRDLPSKARRDIMVPLTDAKTIRLCDEVQALLLEKGIDLNTATSEMLDGLSSGPVFKLLSKARAALATAKMPAALDLAESYEEQGEPLVVMSQHKVVAAFGQREGWGVVTGDTPLEQRQALVDSFQRGELKGLAGTIGALGVGFTLTHSSHILFVDSTWTPALNVQAEDRICRIGQPLPCLITRLVTTHAVDYRVTEIVTEKQELIDGSVEAAAIQDGLLPENPLLKLKAAAVAASVLVEESNAQAQAEVAAAEARRSAVVAEVQKRVASLWDGREMKVSATGKARGPANAEEAHAIAGLTQVAGLDPDHAHERNNVGFSKYDNEFGHSLVQQFQASQMLTDKQWVSALRLARRYRRQIGPV